ncbi:hypothetical protein DV701_07195 [Ornithinimicrobium avium]|uniref:Uncharacterized protein n=1 Tax=Ornithinimicrobium avium TaxID=2283195 RepID=A0A345NLN3_9MICO|nr:hypothetical protein DV701_07195 [Ornithinimicrobium avium]
MRPSTRQHQRAGHTELISKSRVVADHAQLLDDDHAQLLDDDAQASLEFAAIAFSGRQPLLRATACGSCSSSAAAPA